MKKLVLNLFFFIVCFSIIHAQNIKQTISLDYNSKSGLTYHNGYDRNSFTEVFVPVNDYEYAFLSQTEGKIIIMDIGSNKIVKEIQCVFPVYDMTYYNSQFWLTGKQDVFVLNKNGELINKIPYKESMLYIDKIIFNNGYTYFCDPAQNSYRIEKKGFVKIQGIPLNDGSFGFVSREGNADIRFTRIINDGIQKTWHYKSDKRVGTVKIIGSSADKVILDVQSIVQEIPLEVERSIFIIDISGEKIALEKKIKMPNVYYTYIRRDMLVHDQTLDIMISAPKGNTIYSVDLDIISKTDSLFFPGSLYLFSYHYNSHLKSAKSLEKEQVNIKAAKSPITRPQIIANAEPYDTYVWTCSSANIVDEDCGGVHVTTPSWVQVGTNVSIPYMWGGWSTLTQYDQGIAAGVSAGDCYTVGAGSGSSCAVGVDCSGFVSVAWELPWKYGTSTLPNISTAYASFDELKPGDIVNNAGSHVRLVHTCYGNGSWLVIEASASATNWCVGYSTYTTADLQSSYIPRYYDDVIDGPVDTIPPVTYISASGWKTADFQVSFVDTDDLCLGDRFYMVSDYNGTEWRANANHGFFDDEFDSAINTEWTNLDGNWSVISGALNQSDETNSNTNIYAGVQQSSGNIYLYHWKMKISGSGTNRRAGIYFFSDDASQLQRNNAYMVYFRVDQNNCQIYKSTNNSISLESESSCTVNADEWYDCKVIFNPTTGKINVYLDDALVGTWVDTSPHTTGNAISLRTGECNVSYDNIRVYKSRGSSETVSLGSGNDVRYQNPSSAQPSCKIFSLITDSAGFMSDCDSVFVNIDWTEPDDVVVADGLGADVDTIYLNTELSANWSASLDVQSGIAEYYYCIGDTPNGNNIVNWTSAGNMTHITHSGLSLVYDSTYYISVKAVNNAGLESNILCSDGQILKQSTNAPNAEFSPIDSVFCAGDSVTFINYSSNATSFEWTFSGGNPSFSTDNNPVVNYQTGNYIIQLIAHGSGGTDTTLHNYQFTFNDPPGADFSAMDTALYLPGANAVFVNNSQNATGYTWYFGDGYSSNDQNPWHTYNAAGFYNITLIAGNAYCPDDTLLLVDYIHVYDISSINNEINDDEIVVYPNPGYGDVYVKGVDIQEAILIDMTGKVIKSMKIKDLNREFHFNNLESGIYYIKVIHKNKALLKKIVVY